MKPSMPTPLFTQNAYDAMNLLEKAETLHQAIQVTPKGNIKILHQKPTQLPSSKLSVVQAVMEKMQTEAAALAPTQTGRNILGFLSLRMPSLSLFAMSGKIGNLREEWQEIKQTLQQPGLELQEEAFIQFNQMQQERLKICEEMAQALPAGLNMSIEDGAVSSLNHVFSVPEQNELLTLCRTAMEGVSIDKASGMVGQTLKDLHRQQMTFIVETPAESHTKKGAVNSNDGKFITTKKEFGTGHKEEKISALLEVAGNNSRAANTLGALTNQEMLKMMAHLFSVAHPTQSSLATVTKQKEKTEEVQLYTLRRRTDGDVELSYLRLRGIEKLLTIDGQQEWKINSEPRFQGDLSESNFGVKQKAKILLKKSDLEQGILNPAFVEPPTESITVCPDFADISRKIKLRRPISP